MIAKRVALKSIRRSDFAGLVRYILSDLGKNERIGCVSVTNCESDQADVAVTEVLNTQAQNTRAQSDKTYHLIVSFREGEQVDDSTLKTIEARMCDALGFGDHQRVSAVHHDTDNLHIHIAINKIHPTRYTLHEPYRDFKTLSQLCKAIEAEFNFQRDNHSPRKSRAENCVDDMEQHTGIESLLGWIRRECSDQMLGAQSWTAMHDVMRTNGLRLHERGNGLVITADDKTRVKASSVDRRFSKPNLEARLGPFETAAESPTSVKPHKTYEPKPLHFGIDTTLLYGRYQAEREMGSALRTGDLTRLRDRKKNLIEAAKRRARLKRASIKLIKASRPAKKLLYALASKALKDDLKRIHTKISRERKAVTIAHPRPAWADWLQSKAEQGDQTALAALRARNATRHRKARSVAAAGRLTQEGIPAAQDGVTKHGTIVYCAGNTSVRDDGKQLHLSRTTDQAGLEAALRMALARYGDCIHVEGNDAFKDDIAKAAAMARLPLTFDDVLLERRRMDYVNESRAMATSDAHAIGSRFAVRSNDRKQAAVTHTTATNAEQSNPSASAKPSGPELHSDVGTVGTNPPPASRSQLRNLSEVGVIRVANADAISMRPGVPDDAAYINKSQPKEQDDAQTIRNRIAERSDERDRPVVDRPVAVHSKQSNQFATAKRAVPAHEPDPGPIGKEPPPASRYGLRNLSELGVVRFADGGAMLLPRDVSGDMAQHGSTANHRVRRSRDMTQPMSAPMAAAHAYIAEREEKRARGMAIPLHRHYQDGDTSTTFAGLREVNGQKLALLQQREVVLVHAVDDRTARRLKRMKRGDVVSMAPLGMIKTKGRSR